MEHSHITFIWSSAFLSSPHSESSSACLLLFNLQKSLPATFNRPVHHQGANHSWVARQNTGHSVKFGFQINNQYFYKYVPFNTWEIYIYNGHSIFLFAKSLNLPFTKTKLYQLFINLGEKEKIKFTVFFHKLRFSNIGTGKERQDRLDDLTDSCVVRAISRYLWVVVIL